MQRAYKALEGQSIYDVCLQTYGTQNLLAKLIADNGAAVVPGKVFNFDSDLVADELIASALVRGRINYATSTARSINSVGIITEDGFKIVTEDYQTIVTE